MFENSNIHSAIYSRVNINTVKLWYSATMLH